MKCRHCHTPLEHVFIDLGFAPPSNAYLTTEQLNKPELYFPLKLFVCDKCWLVQTEDFTNAADLFDDEYAYFSSTSKSWLKHAENYTLHICKQLNLNQNSFVIEIASNDGYLLKNFIQKNIPCIGIEPTQSTAAASEALGIPVIREFFGADLGERLKTNSQQADLIIGNNVYAHVPDINNFTKGLKNALKPKGTITLEFPHLMQLIKHCQFDTIYHEHFSYLSLYSVMSIFEREDLKIYDVETLSTHGGSLRIYGCHSNDKKNTSINVSNILEEEKSNGLQTLTPYLSFQEKANRIKNNLIALLIEKKNQGLNVAAYGAAAKGNTLLNYAGLKTDLINYVYDAAKSKQGKFLPGSHIPILKPEKIKHYKPDIIIILPWNIKEEVVNQLNFVKEWGGIFVTVVPEVSYIQP
jgi:SAM-dependent methyltransferase